MNKYWLVSGIAYHILVILILHTDIIKEILLHIDIMQIFIINPCGTLHVHNIHDEFFALIWELV